jgi:Spy/CpxP family protein refolding chaperone
MRPSIKRVLLGLMGASVLLGGLAACGHRGGFSAHASPEEQAQWRGKMVERVGSRLDLSAEQKAKLDALAVKLQEQRTALMGTTTDPRAELQTLVSGDKFDRARAQTLVREKTTALTTKSPEVIAAMGDFYDSLSPAQQGKVREYLQGRRGWWRS